MINTIIFFNWFHNGDIHVSRTFVKEIVQKVSQNNISCHYMHRSGAKLLQDIDKLKFYPNTNIGLNEHIISHQQNNVLFLNTWYAAGNRKYYNTYGLSYNCLYHLFEEHVTKYLNFSLKDVSINPEYFYPDIDFSKYEINNVSNWLNTCNNCKKVLICNGLSLSGQSTNFNMDNIIYNLCNTYHGILFITTNPTTIKRENLFYSKDLIKANGNDLNENAYLSTKCDIIIGRLSGAHTFSYNKENMFLNNKIFICLGNSEIESRWYSQNDFTLNYTSKIYHSSSIDTNEISNMCKNIIVKHLS